MEIIKNEVMFLYHGYDLKAHRNRPSADLKAMSDSGMFRMSVQGGVAVIPVKGPINRGEGYYGETDINDVVSNCQRAMLDPSVSAVIMKFDTPGGTASGCQMAADAIAALSAVKPTVAHCDMCCSAGYFMASQTRKIYATSDAMIGSIGTTTELIDASEYYAKAGIKVFEINTGDYKGVGNPSQPVTDEHKAYVQGIIDELFSGFVKAVASGRKISQQKVRDMQAKIFIGNKATDAGLIDGICSMTECYQSVSKLASKASSKANNMAQNRITLANSLMKIR